MIEEIILLESKNFADFALIDTGAGERLERWGKVIVRRPDPQVIWPRHLAGGMWEKAQAIFAPAAKGERGVWKFTRPLPEPWTVGFSKVRFLLKPSPFKHLGLFAEQAANWAWMKERLKMSDLRFQHRGETETKNQNAKFRILNLFAYTGGATMVLTAAGHFVTHVDASKPAIAWAKANQRLNGFAENSTRWILDDAVKFVNREVRRGSRYDAILMDPPAFGHGPSGRMWKFNQNLPGLLADSVRLLSPNARFLLVNGYATNSSALALGNLVNDVLAGRSGRIEAGELCLRETGGRLLSTGIFSRWSPIGMNS